MANTVTNKIIRDGYRNADVLLLGSMDTAVAVATFAAQITLAQFTANDPGYKPFNGFRVDRIEYVIADSLSLFLTWDATAPQPIANLYGRGILYPEPYGAELPAVGAAGYTGAISLEVDNVAPPASTKQAFTLLLCLTKLYVIT